MPAASATPETTTKTRRVAADGACPTGSSCSSQARIPVCATASEMAAAVSFAASYFTFIRWPTTSASSASRPDSFFSLRSRSATSSWQSIPSTLKTDSAWISQTWQVAISAGSPRAPRSRA
jgi:hypothetical protein